MGAKTFFKWILSKFIRQKKSQQINFRWAEIFSTKTEYITRLAEISCQEFATLGDAAVGTGLLARSHILRVRMNILTRFFFNIKIHLILYTII
jgi:hypothetical protein